MSQTLSLVMILAATFCAVPSAAGALKVGSPAPKVEVGRWAQGDAVKEFEEDKVYIVEFWATWCGPCVASIPHLNEIHARNKDKGLVVIGQNLGEDAKTVGDFVKKMGSKMTYRVAVDNQSGTMAKTWLEAAGQNGIPCAFVVNKRGKLAYIGHPMELKESVLESLLAEPSTKAPSASAGPAVAVAPSAKAMALATGAEAALQSGKLDEAEGKIAELHESLGDNLQYIAGLLDIKLLLARKQPDDAIQLAKMISEDFAGKPAVLNASATCLVSPPDASPALQSAAEKIVTPISAAAGDGQSAALTTLARIAFQRGDKAGAVEFQAKAVAAASPAEAPTAKSALEAYQQGRLP